MLNTYQDMFAGHYYSIPDGYKAKMRINQIGLSNVKKFAKIPTSSEIEAAALKAGFDVKITFPQAGRSGLTKFYKITEYESEQGVFYHERNCLNESVKLSKVL